MAFFHLDNQNITNSTFHCDGGYTLREARLSVGVFFTQVNACLADIYCRPT